MDNGRRPIGRPRNTFKQDYEVYLGGGSGAGQLVTQPGFTKYTFWVDHNPFATFIRRLITKNVYFEIFKTATNIGGGLFTGDAGSEADLYVSFDQSNDRPDEMFTNPAELSAKRVVLVPGSILPPYFFVTTTIKQPVDPKYITDQGNFVYDAYEGGGLGMAKTGVNDFQCQAFIPTSPYISSIFTHNIFHIGTHTDPTRYRDIIIELWDGNRNFYANLGIIPKEYVPGSKPHNHIDVNGNKITTATDTFVTATDSNQYWIEIDEARCIPAQPIQVVPGQTYYIVYRHASPIADFLYGVGANTNRSVGGYNGKGRYIYGSSFSGVGVAGSNTITNNGTDVHICFTTQRNTGRTAITFYWGSPTYWWSDPLQYKGQFEFVKEDFDQAEI